MTSFDFAVIAIMVLSALVGWWRGFMYELFSLIGWLAAYIVARTYSAQVTPYVPLAVGAENIRSAAAFAALFIVTLIVGALFAWFLARLAKFAGLSGMDGKFGAIFGMLRGGLVVIALVWLGGLTDLPQLPFWRNALSSKPLQQAALYARDYLPEDTAKK
ncbi:CvpA family protein [Sideroxydans lithotrophicus]|uniref:Colicin V production protein n=1 Tax=Sideroxydans lithotrophicus (strain ES-1) TaxID=580332 RepID=D5CU25_SIDLE|nr:CvpA family protein [Sideroxydans lithotrophicus]ADE12337.1 Colicin V production protein [Sideroxydans lithotrophicus ES-1]